MTKPGAEFRSIIAHESERARVRESPRALLDFSSSSPCARAYKRRSASGGGPGGPPTMCRLLAAHGWITDNYDGHARTLRVNVPYPAVVLDVLALSGTPRPHAFDGGEMLENVGVLGAVFPGFGALRSRRKRTHAPSTMVAHPKRMSWSPFVNPSECGSIT
jgi:hypothetical protein